MACASNRSNINFTAGRTADGAKDTKNEAANMVEQPLNEETWPTTTGQKLKSLQSSKQIPRSNDA